MMNNNLEPKPIKIIEVWADNLDSEFVNINSVLSRYPFVSMDTEFPGVIYPVASTGYPIVDKRLIRSPFYQYRALKANVDALKIIQIGFTLSDAAGNLPDFNTDSCYIWQFNFRDFDISRDDFAPDSIELLKRQGINFENNKKMGIDSARFAGLFFHSVLRFNNNNLTWVTFHSLYDFGYLIKMFNGGMLPYQLGDFLVLVNYYFGARVYDIKYMMRFYNMHGGLEDIARTLNVAREVGKHHQAGSDSLVTLKTFMKLNDEIFFTGDNIYTRCAGILYGLEVIAVVIV